MCSYGENYYIVKSYKNDEKNAWSVLLILYESIQVFFKLLIYKNVVLKENDEENTWSVLLILYENIPSFFLKEPDF